MLLWRASRHRCLCPDVTCLPDLPDVPAKSSLPACLSFMSCLGCVVDFACSACDVFLPASFFVPFALVRLYIQFYKHRPLPYLFYIPFQSNQLLFSLAPPPPPRLVLRALFSRRRVAVGGSGIVVLSPASARAYLRGRPVQHAETH